MSISALETSETNSKLVHSSHHSPGKRGLQNTPPAPSRAQKQTPKSALPMGKFGQQRRMKSISRRIKHRTKRLNAIERRQQQLLTGEARKRKKWAHPRNGVHRQIMQRHHMGRR